MGLTEAEAALLADVDAARVVRIWRRDQDVRVYPRLHVKGRIERLRKRGLVFLPRQSSAVSTAWCLSEKGAEALASHSDPLHGWRETPVGG